MNDHPDFIAVEVLQTARVEANAADISVTVAGAALFSGAVALQKAREVAELVAALKTVGVTEAQIKVESVSAHTQSGTFSKSSSVSYALLIEKVPLERVAEAIGVITSAKNATLVGLEWRFVDETPLRDQLRARCLELALERARFIARTLGVRLLGVYELNEEWEGTQEQSSTHRRTAHLSMMSRARVSEAELGIAISHAEDVEMKLHVQFRVSEFGA